MKLTRLKGFLRSKERTYPRFVGLLRRAARSFNGRRATYPRIMGREIAAVANVLRTSNWNMNYGGDLVHQRLEAEFASYIGTRYAVAVNTGGMAIQIALRAFGVKPGNEVIHQVDTCVANAFAIMAAAGTPIFADINKDDFMLARDYAEKQISPQTKVIMPVHMWGNPENMDWVTQTAKENALYRLEDACLSLGAEWKGRRVGSLGDAGVFSLGSLKPIQAGEGGIIVTNDEALAKELRTIRSWGEMTHEYGVRDQRTLSWNGRMSEIVAAVALEQLRGYPKYLENLEALVAVFINHLDHIDGMDLAVPQTENARPTYHQVVVKLDPTRLGVCKRDLMSKLSEKGVGVWHANFEPINTLGFFRSGSWKDWILKGDMERVERNYNHRFVGSEDVYATVGLGFSRSNFLSADSVKFLIRELDRVLSKRSLART